jgi:23S rRNA pseudouridine1911/1915/1917 synthase
MMPEPEFHSSDSDDLQDEWIIRVDANQRPIRIDSFLNDRIKNVSRTRIQHGIKAGSVTVDGQRIKPNFKIAPHQTIKVLVPHQEETEIIPEKMDLAIFYEDADLLVINKPAGLVVHPGIGNRSGTLLNGLAHYLDFKPQALAGDGFNFSRLGLVHRIDKETSGLLVIAKNEFALQHLAKQFYDHSSTREYHALVWSEPTDNEGTIDVPIGRNPRNRQSYAVFPDRDQGKSAITHWSVIERLYYVSLVRCKLETGRTHQIRVHMQSIGHPVFNDERYGGNRIVKGTVYSKYKQFVDNLFGSFPRHALHAKSLGFEHPVTGKWMQFDSELPPEFQSVINAWRLFVKNQKDLRK